MEHKPFYILRKCSNKKCPAIFHKDCWKKYLQVNELEKSYCKMCCIGKVSIINESLPDYGEVQSCTCCHYLFGS